MAEATEVRKARDSVRVREQAAWTEVERVGRDLRADRLPVSQAEVDAPIKKTKQIEQP